MKKLLSVLLVISMLILALSSCDLDSLFDFGNNSERNPSNNKPNPYHPDFGINNGNNYNGENDGENVDNSADTQLYNRALSLISEGSYEDAYAILLSLKDYAPAKKKLKNFSFAPSSMTMTTTVATGKGTETTEAISHYKYDKSGNILSISNENGTFYFEYDSNGNILTGYDILNPSESIIYTYTYKNGRVSTVTYAYTEKTYEYDSKGNIFKITTADSLYDIEETETYSYTYYGNGRIEKVTVTDSANYIMEYHYDSDGKLTKHAAANNEYYPEIALTYEGGRLVSMKAFYDSTPIYIYEYTYNTDGALIEGRFTMSSTTDEITYTISDPVLIYSEDPTVHSNIAKINYQGDFDFTV